MELPPLDRYHLRAALGWLELGDADTALTELDQMSPESQATPDTLEVRWFVLTRQENWDAAALVGHALIIAAPERASSWLNHSYALRRAARGGLLAAFTALSSVVEKFPKESTIPFNLACYTCQLQRDATETLAWLRRAMQAGEARRILAMALNDPDLEPLRSEIAQLGKAA